MPTRPLSLSLHTRIMLGVLLAVVSTLGVAGLCRSYFYEQQIVGSLFALLSLVSGASAWWWLRKQLAPLQQTEAILQAMNDGPCHSLPVRRDDAVGQAPADLNTFLAAAPTGATYDAEQALNARLRKIVSNVPGVVFQYRLQADGRAGLPFVSDGIQEIYGVQAILADTEKMGAVLHPEDRDVFFSALHESARLLSPWYCEYRIRPTTGGEKWLQISALPERDADGTTLWSGFITDITRIKEAEGELRIAAATFESQQGMFITDAAHHIIRINHAFTELTGYGPEVALGKTPDLLRPTGADEMLYQDMYQSLNATGVWQGELWNRHRDGTPFAVWKTVSAVRDTLGKVTHYVAAFSDITERKRAEERLRHNKDLMQAILSAIQESIFLIDPQDIVIAVNPTAARRMGMEARDMVGKDLFSLFPAEVAESRRALTHQVLRSGQPQVTEDARNDMTFFNSFYPLFEASGKVEAVVVVATDITERKRLEQNLEQQARTDPLTGLFNRRHFMALAEAELARATRYRAPLSVLMLDIDHFKRINDTRGHRTGDLVLQHLARLAKQTLRDVDIVGRLGGEEFAILLPQTEGEQAMEVAERLRLAIAGSKVMPDAGLPLHYTASLGVAGVTEGGLTNVDTLLNEADQAMYDAKKAGRNRICRDRSHPA